MRKLATIIMMLFIIVDRFSHKLTVSHTITAKFVYYNHPWFNPLITYKQTFEKSLCSMSIAFLLNQYINNITILLNGSPKIVV